METIELNLTQEELCTLALAAHDLDITLNEFIVQSLREFIKDADESS